MRKAIHRSTRQVPATGVRTTSIVLLVLTGLAAAAACESRSEAVDGLMTPLPRGMPGVFVISPNEAGLVEQTTPCADRVIATRTVDSTPWYLCGDAGPEAYQRTMDSTWTNPAVTGVFIRLKWSDLQTGPASYDPRILLREVDRAVASGKLYSLAIKSGAENDATPAWLFQPPPAGAGLTPVTLDWNEDSPSCTTRPHDYGDPTDETYRSLYLDMLSYVAGVLKQDGARWRSLAYIKISGANARSAENRLPNGCKVGPGCICNNQRWAEAGYTPDGVLAFYQAQMERIARDFPGKTMSYPLIQDGFPRVNNQGCYLDDTSTKICPPSVNTRMVGPFAQTEAIIAHARSVYGDDVAVAHLGLGPKPDFSDPLRYAPGTGCPLPLAPDGSYAHGGNGVGSGCPNKWATDVGAVGGLTHFQTRHAPDVETPAQLASALDNLWSNSNAAMLEIYEEQAWQAHDGILDLSLPSEEQRTLAQWNQRLHERRRTAFPAFGDPTFTTKD
jgi:hypothetical protein